MPDSETEPAERMRRPYFIDNRHVFVDFAFPLRGLCDARAWTKLPEFTTSDLLNMMPGDRSLRERGSTRPGTVSLWTPPAAIAGSGSDSGT